MNRRRNIAIPLLPVLIVFAPPCVEAGDIDSEVRAAKKACLVGDVEKGIDILAELFMSTNDATHLYNQARCYEQNAKNEQAVARFKEYLRKAKGLPPAEVDSIRKRIDELESSTSKPASPPIAAPAVQNAPSAPTPLPVSAAPSSMPETPMAVDLTQPVSPPENQESEPVYKRWWFWTGIGVLVAGGVATALLLSSASAPKSPDCTGVDACVR